MVIKELVIDQWAGKNLREMDLTNRFNIQVIATRQGGSEKFKFIPKADQRLEKDDVLVAIGHVEQIEN